MEIVVKRGRKPGTKRALKYLIANANSEYIRKLTFECYRSEIEEILVIYTADKNLAFPIKNHKKATAVAAILNMSFPR